jgi:hypothetical protein
MAAGADRCDARLVQMVPESRRYAIILTLCELTLSTKAKGYRVNRSSAVQATVH